MIHKPSLQGTLSAQNLLDAFAITLTDDIHRASVARPQGDTWEQGNTHQIIGVGR